MRTTHLCLLMSAIAIVTCANVPATPTAEAKTSAIKSLETAKAEGAALSEAGKPADATRAYESAARSVAASLGADTDAGDVLTRALASTATIDDPAARAGRLNLGLQEAIVALNFKPKTEAELPEGFPAPGPVGEVIVKKYPAYRAARTPMAKQNEAFWTLFKHIETNEIAMSAPVEMRYAKPQGNAAAAPAPQSMAFLYSKPEMGRPGQQGAVEVTDVPAMTVVSIGVRGSYTDERLAEMTKRLEAWIDAHRGEYEADGGPRLLGYNSPMVPPWFQCAEVQIPLKPHAGARPVGPATDVPAADRR